MRWLALVALVFTPISVWGQNEAAPEGQPSEALGAGQKGPAEEPEWARGVSDEDRREAFAMYATANTIALEGDQAEAAELYEKALKKWNHPAIHYNLARALIRLQKPVEALRSVEEALRYGTDALDADPDHAKELYRNGEDYKALLLGQLAVVEVECAQADVKVALDGRPILSCPGTASEFVKPGDHQLVATRPGFTTETVDIDSRAGRTTKNQIELAPVVTVIAPRPQIRYVTRFRTWIPWTVLGTGLTIASAGIPLAVSSANLEDRFETVVADECAAGCAELPDEALELRDSGRRRERLAIAAFTVGGVASAVGIVLVVLNRPREVKQSLQVGPMSAHGARGAQLVWTF